MNKILDKLQQITLNRLATRLKHLRGKHDQLDHAWNRGMGQGGGGVGLAPNQMGPLPTADFYRKRRIELMSQQREGLITNAEMRREMRQLRGVTVSSINDNVTSLNSMVLANQVAPTKQATLYTEFSFDILNSIKAQRKLVSKKQKKLYGHMKNALQFISLLDETAGLSHQGLYVDNLPAFIREKELNRRLENLSLHVINQLDYFLSSSELHNLLNDEEKKLISDFNDIFNKPSKNLTKIDFAALYKLWQSKKDDMKKIATEYIQDIKELQWRRDNKYYLYENLLAEFANDEGNSPSSESLLFNQFSDQTFLDSYQQYKDFVQYAKKFRSDVARDAEIITEEIEKLSKYWSEQNGIANARLAFNKYKQEYIGAVHDFKMALNRMGYSDEKIQILEDNWSKAINDSEKLRSELMDLEDKKSKLKEEKEAFYLQDDTPEAEAAELEKRFNEISEQELNLYVLISEKTREVETNKKNLEKAMFDLYNAYADVAENSDQYASMPDAVELKKHVRSIKRNKEKYEIAKKQIDNWNNIEYTGLDLFYEDILKALRSDNPYGNKVQVNDIFDELEGSTISELDKRILENLSSIIPYILQIFPDSFYINPAYGDRAIISFKESDDNRASMRTRRNHSGVESTMSVTSRTNTSTMVHETLHYMTDAHPELFDMIFPFIKSRLMGETPVQLKKEFPNSNYEDYEWGFYDKTDSPYTFKWYPDTTSADLSQISAIDLLADWDKSRWKEVWTMAFTNLQGMHERKDKKLFQEMLSIIFQLPERREYHMGKESFGGIYPYYPWPEIFKYIEKS